MKQEDKELLLKDLCARLPYGVYMHHKNYPDAKFKFIAVFDDGRIGVSENGIPLTPTSINECIPYLRSISKLTPEEKNEIEEISNCRIKKIVLERSNRSPYKVISEKHYLDNNFTEFDTFGDSDYVFSHVDQDRMVQVIDWFNEHHVDYRGFILKGWALEAPKDMYKDCYGKRSN